MLTGFRERGSSLVFLIIVRFISWRGIGAPRQQHPNKVVEFDVERSLGEKRIVIGPFIG